MFLNALIPLIQAVLPSILGLFTHKVTHVEVKDEHTVLHTQCGGKVVAPDELHSALKDVVAHPDFENAVKAFSEVAKVVAESQDDHGTEGAQHAK